MRDKVFKKRSLRVRRKIFESTNYTELRLYQYIRQGFRFFITNIKY